jgi:radical SAM protein with 4Fe4S-binding SPASM domain
MTDNTSFSRLAPSFLPTTAVLEMTYRCNHGCLFCSCPWFDDKGSFNIRPEMDAQQWKSLISRLCTMGIMNIAFTGGEPLLKEGIEEILIHAANCTTEHIETEKGRLVSRFEPPKLYLLTNGKILNDAILDLCAKYKIHLSLSLPGLRTFSYHTNGDDPHKILDGFKKAKDKGIETTVGVTVTQQNIHELYETIAHAFIAGADDLLMNRFLPGGRGLQYAGALNLNRQQIPVMLDIAESVLKEANRKGHVGTELPKCVFEADKYKNLQVASRCSAARDFFVVDPSGFTRVCNHSPVRLNHVDQLEQLKTNAYWKQFIQKDYLPQMCSSCHQNLQCDGGCREAAHILGNHLKSPDPALIEKEA